ncbi:MAG: 6-bladed beta-propeller [Chloroherpetonaceae bacterium]|nr:6-bladed beta-propeller [Chloroherpetonaceae bacterium]
MLISPLICSVLLLYSRSFSSATQQGNSQFRRNYKNVQLKKISEFDIVARVVNMKFFNSYLYVYDFQTQRILKLDAKGDIVQSFGKKGLGPGEFMQIMGWDVDDAGVSCDDITKLSITEFSQAGERINYFKIDKPFYSSMRLEKDLYLLLSPSYKKGEDPKTPVPLLPITSLFSLFNAKNKTLSEVIFPLPEATTQPLLAYDGFFVSHSQSGKYFFVCRRFGGFFAFDKKGKIKFTARTIDMSPPPKIIFGETGSASYDKKSPFINESASATDKYLFILSLVRESEINQANRGVVVDVYDVDTGQYLYSFELPNYNNAEASEIAVSNKQIFAYYGEKIVVFTYTE